MGNDGRPVLVRIGNGEVKTNEPLPWAIYDAFGNLLLRRGFIITSERQRDNLLERGLHREEAPGGGARRDDDSCYASNDCTVFEAAETLISRLEAAYALLATRRKGAFKFKILQLAVEIQRICQGDADSVLGVMQMDKHSPYGLIHPLHVAVLCELMGRALGIRQLSRLSLVAAALTHDLGFYELQETLHRQVQPLSDEQWAEVKRHPTAGHALLTGAGIDDECWLRSVIQHHERLDGSGYPSGLKGDDIAIPSRILSIADIYTAMIRPRSYRTAILARDALREIFEERGKTVDERLAKAFVKTVGIFPPGAFVRLENNELAVVSSRGEDAVHPQVHSLIAAQGRAYTRPMPRDSRENGSGVHSMIPDDEVHMAHGVLSLLWPKIPALGIA
jgi:HD-GYP domain-containing protein (c-di-GMP phosphodiesterase class II)